ncbi:molybdenum cofactor guanylyltransferase [Roseofilum casamattae]|uniref:Probable molybdenum cofactor guanylyltransferase n=1 Tax=Roseofilum casamattae BLCC-M143 TaxID=3022442 RepID=A0ABT7BXX5_9CYAN|nr:molybdenum cofactor guanylyltransferase [Roseofilum casamattae]MDJ1184049.1 molybdenum cofactor guanylyltransferase [Roseofilum casamattae BLCC-M143]
MSDRTHLIVDTLILAGGRSSRMGQDKALLPWQGSPMLARAIAVAKQCTRSTYIMTPWPERYQEITSVPSDGCQWIAETLAGQGPLVAFARAVDSMSSEWILLLACDLPQLDATVLHRWIHLASSVPDSILAMVPHHEGKWEPLCALYRRAIGPHLQDFITIGGDSFQQWLSQIPVYQLPVDGTVANMLHNCNCPEDLENSRL